MPTTYTIIDKHDGSVIGTATSLSGARRVVREENAFAAGRYGYKVAA